MRLVSTLPAKHIAFLRAEDLVLHLDDAASQLRQLFAQHSEHCAVTFISGPSRTGAIEMKLTLGVHGPEESHVILLEEGAIGGVEK